MKITFVTESHAWGDDKRTVDVVRQKDLDKANARVDALLESFGKASRMLKTAEKRLSQVERSLANVDRRLRDDCRAVFAKIIEESLSPVFSVMKLQAQANGVAASSGDAGACAKRTAVNAPRKKLPKKRKRGTGKC